MGTKLIKCVLSLGTALLLGLICFNVWGGIGQTVPAERPLPGLVAAFSDVPAESTYFWVTFAPVRPEDHEDMGRIDLSYRLSQSSPNPATVSYVFSGQYAGKIKACAQQSITIRPDVRFDALPQSARLALIAVVQRGQQSSGGTAPQIGSDIAAVTAAKETYTEITIPVQPKLGGSTQSTDSNSIGAEGTYSCTADLSDMWTTTSGDMRIVSPAVGAAAPFSAKGGTYIYPGISMSTSDQFFVLRSTVTPKQDGSLSTIADYTDTLSNSEGFDNAVASSTAVTFSSTAAQNSVRNGVLLVGVLLGAAVSVFIGSLSLGYDLVAERVRR